MPNSQRYPALDVAGTPPLASRVPVSSHVDDGGSDVQHMNMDDQEHLEQSKCERPFESSHVEDGGGAAQIIIHLLVLAPTGYLDSPDNCS
jgi:hypothetical protein